MIGTVNVANTAQQATLVTALTTSFPQNGTIGGFPIVSSTF